MDEGHHAFVKRLADSSQFQCFCDNYFLEDEINNFKMFFSIVSDDELSPDDKEQRQLAYLQDKLGYSED